MFPNPKTCCHNYCTTAVIVSLLCIATLLSSTNLNAALYPPPPPWQPDPAQREHLRRSLTLLNTSTPSDRKTVRVLFYGQSITQQVWWREIEQFLRATYPNANLIIENRAIGGHSSQLLVKTADADLYPFQPDLLIFHVYGSHVDYETIIRRIREHTSADILLQTDHITRDEGLEEETDPGKLTPQQWDAWMNNVFLPATAAKYSVCRADVHQLWKAYLRTHHLKASELLKDGVHLNAHGEWLMAEILKRYLAPLQAISGYDPLNNAVVRTVPVSPTAVDSTKIEFTGHRVDLVFKPGASGSVSVLIDGKKPSSIPDLFGFTRVSAFPNSDWPILLKIGTQAPLVEEAWSLKISDITADGKLCRFGLTGSLTGEDGEGWNTNRFLSRSRRVIIEPDDWNLAYCTKVFQKPLSEGHVATWRVVLRGKDMAEAPAVDTGGEAGVTVAQGLAPGRHVLELRAQGLERCIQSARFYTHPK